MDKNKILPEIKNPEVLQDAIGRYGAPAQIDMAIEEMSELTKAILKNRRNYAAITADERGRLREAIIEEAADVIVTVAQVVMIYAEPEEIQAEVDFKINRLRERLKGDEIIRRNLSGKDTNVPANAGWIPVGERLPEDAEDVIATTENGEEITLAWYGGDDWRSAIDGDSINVIAWMPLPEPYREEKRR